MENNKRENKSRSKFPILTKISIGWLFLAPIIGFTIYVNYKSSDIGGSLFPEFYFIGIFIALVLYWLPGIFLTARRRWCWDIAVFLLSTYAIGILIFCIGSYQHFIQFWEIEKDNVLVYASCFGSALLPLILVLLDRRNYFKMIHERALARLEEDEDNQ